MSENNIVDSRRSEQPEQHSTVPPLLNQQTLKEKITLALPPSTTEYGMETNREDGPRLGPPTITASSDDQIQSQLQIVDGQLPRPLLEPETRQEIRDYIEAYKAEIVDSSSVEIDDKEVQRIKSRYQDMMMYHREIGGRIFWEQEQRQATERIDYPGPDQMAQEIKDISAGRKFKRKSPNKSQDERMKPKRSVLAARAGSPGTSSISKNVKVVNISNLQKCEGDGEERGGAQRDRGRSKSSAKRAVEIVDQSTPSHDRKSPAASTESAQLLKSLPKKRSVQQMIKDHNRKQELLEKERRLQRQVELEQAQKRTILLRNRSFVGRQRSQGNPLNEQSKSKSKDRVRTSHKQLQQVGKQDFQTLPKLSSTVKGAGRSGLPLPVLKNQMATKPALRGMHTTKNAGRVSQNQNFVMRAPTPGSSGLVEPKKRLTLMKKSHSLSKSFKLQRPLEIINEASRANDSGLLKVKIPPKPRPPAQLPAISSQGKNKKIKIFAIKKQAKKKKGNKLSRSVPHSQERPRPRFNSLFPEYDEIRCKTCLRHNRNFSQFSASKRQDKIKKINAQYNLSNINLMNQKQIGEQPQPEPTGPAYKAEHFEEAAEFLQLSMLDQNKKIRDMHLKNEMLSQKVSKLQRKLSQSQIQSKTMMTADETQPQLEPVNGTGTEPQPNTGPTTLEQKRKVKRDESKKAQQIQKMHDYSNRLQNNVRGSENKLKILEKEYISCLKKIQKYQKTPNIEDKLLREIQSLDQQIATEKLKQVENEKNQRQIDRIQTRKISIQLGGAHTEKAAQAEKNNAMGQQYKRLVQENQIIQDKIKSSENFIKQTKVQKMVNCEERIRQAEQVLQFYKDQAKTIDREVHRFTDVASVANAPSGTDGAEQQKEKSSDYDYTIQQIKIKEAEELKAQVHRVQRDVRAIKKSKMSHKQLFEADFLRNEKQILQLEQLIHELKSRIVLRCEAIKEQREEIIKIVMNKNGMTTSESELGGPTVNGEEMSADAIQFTGISITPSLPKVGGRMGRLQNQLIIDHDGSRIGVAQVPDMQSNSMASLLRDFDPNAANKSNHHDLNGQALDGQQSITIQNAGTSDAIEDYRSAFSLPTGFVPLDEQLVARPTEIVERLVINPESSSNVEYVNSPTQAQDALEQPMVEVAGPNTETKKGSPSLAESALNQQKDVELPEEGDHVSVPRQEQLNTVLRNQDLHTRLDLQIYDNQQPPDNLRNQPSSQVTSPQQERGESPVPQASSLNQLDAPAGAPLKEVIAPDNNQIEEEIEEPDLLNQAVHERCNEKQQRPRMEQERNIISKQLIPVNSTPAVGASSNKPKLSSRMIKKSKEWNLKKSSSVVDLNGHIKDQDPSNYNGPQLKSKGPTKQSNPYLSHLENAMRVFNFKKNNQQQELQHQNNDNQQQNNNDVYRPGTSKKMTHQDIQELRENIMNIDPLSSSKTRSLAPNANCINSQKTSVVEVDTKSKTGMLLDTEWSNQQIPQNQDLHQPVGQNTPDDSSGVDRSDLLRPPDNESSALSQSQQNLEEEKRDNRHDRQPFNNKFTESAVKDVLQKIGLAQQAVDQVCQRQMEKTTPLANRETDTDIGQLDQHSRDMLFLEDQSSTYSLVNEADLQSSSERSGGFGRRQSNLVTASEHRSRGLNHYQDEQLFAQQQQSQILMTAGRTVGRSANAISGIDISQNQPNTIIRDGQAPQTIGVVRAVHQEFQQNHQRSSSQGSQIPF